MKLSALHEFLDLAQSSHDFYGDPASQAKKLNKNPKKGSGESKKDKNDMSHLVGGTADRNRFLKAVNQKRKK